MYAAQDALLLLSKFHSFLAGATCTPPKEMTFVSRLPNWALPGPVRH